MNTRRILTSSAKAVHGTRMWIAMMRLESGRRCIGRFWATMIQSATSGRPGMLDRYRALTVANPYFPEPDFLGVCAESRPVSEWRVIRTKYMYDIATNRQSGLLNTAASGGNGSQRSLRFPSLPVV